MTAQSTNAAAAISSRPSTTAAEPPPRSNSTTIVGEIRMDGRKVGDVITPHLSAELNRAPRAGTNKGR